jgi:hypothetical protein
VDINCTTCWQTYGMRDVLQQKLEQIASLEAAIGDCDRSRLGASLQCELSCDLKGSRNMTQLDVSDAAVPPELTNTDQNQQVLGALRHWPRDYPSEQMPPPSALTSRRLQTSDQACHVDAANLITDVLNFTDATVVRSNLGGQGGRCGHPLVRQGITGGGGGPLDTFLGPEAWYRWPMPIFPPPPPRPPNDVNVCAADVDDPRVASGCVCCDPVTLSDGSIDWQQRDLTADTPEELYLSNVGRTRDGKIIDLRIVAETEYVGWHQGRNGIKRRCSTDGVVGHFGVCVAGSPPFDLWVSPSLAAGCWLPLTHRR